MAGIMKRINRVIIYWENEFDLVLKIIKLQEKALDANNSIYF